MVDVRYGTDTFIQALEHYEDLADIKRVIVHTNALPAEVSLVDNEIVALLTWYTVDGRLFQPSHYGTIDGMPVRDASRQYPSELASCRPDRYEVL